MFRNEHFGRDRHRIRIDRGGIAVAIIAVVNGIGSRLNTTFNDVSTQLK